MPPKSTVVMNLTVIVIFVNGAARTTWSHKGFANGIPVQNTCRKRECKRKYLPVRMMLELQSKTYRMYIFRVYHAYPPKN